jgi:hypothetical protein
MLALLLLIDAPTPTVTPSREWSLLEVPGVPTIGAVLVGSRVSLSLRHMDGRHARHFSLSHTPLKRNSCDDSRCCLIRQARVRFWKFMAHWRHAGR